jgi:predicted nucleic acid-binding protein
MGWLIDTSIWIAVERGHLSAADVRQRAAAALHRISRKPQLRITVETAAVFGALAATLRKARRDGKFRINDLWLAAQAIQRDLSLLTSNPKDFENIPGLRTISMRLS